MKSHNNRWMRWNFAAGGLTAALVLAGGIAAQAQSQDSQTGKDRMMPKSDHMMPKSGAMKGMSGNGDHNQLIASWPEDSKKAAMDMTKKYGPPQEATATMLKWENNGPWKRTVIYSTPVQHDFPMPHKDVMQQFIDYKVPPEKFDELAEYDGSVVAERTNGELSARCDKEAANFLALNLADEVISGQRSPKSAREEYVKQIMAMKAGQPAPLTEKLMFVAMTGDTADPDKAVKMKK